MEAKGTFGVVCLECYIYPGMALKTSSQNVIFKQHYPEGAWVAQSVGHLTLAQVLISWSVGSSPALGSLPTAQSLEPALDSLSPSLCPSLAHALSLLVSQKWINIFKNVNKKRNSYVQSS